MKLKAPALARVRSFPSYDGRFTQFSILNKLGQSVEFTISYREIGLLIRSMQKTARTMGERLFANERMAAAEIAAGLAEAPVLSAVAISQDEATGEVLLWLESAESGAFSFRLSDQAREEIEAALQQHARLSRAQPTHPQPGIPRAAE
jgi:hypothetical protein